MKKRFVDLPKHSRRFAVRGLEKMLRNCCGTSPSQKFWTSEDLDALQREGEKSCFDLLFLGINKFTYWRARFFTKPGAEYFICKNIAFAETYSKLSQDERKQHEAWCDIWYKTIKNGGDLHTLHPLRFESLGGLNFDQFHDMTFQQILKSRPLVEPEFWVRTNYVNGVGLFAIVDTDILDIATIENTIDKFRASGEASYLPRGVSQFCINKLHNLSSMPCAS